MLKFKSTTTEILQEIEPTMFGITWKGTAVLSSWPKAYYLWFSSGKSAEECWQDWSQQTYLRHE